MGYSGLIIFAAVNAVAYVVVTIIGVLAPSAVLLSFSVLMLFAVPGILIVIVVAGRRWYVVAVVGRYLRDASTGAAAADG